jgi:hypothetical protein
VASPDLVHRVLRDGILVLEKDASRRGRFEVRRAGGGSEPGLQADVSRLDG